MPNGVRHPEMASPGLPGDRLILTINAVAALDCLLDDIGTHLTPPEADMVITYVCQRYRKGEIAEARKTLMSIAGVDLTAAYRIEAVLHS